MPLSSIHFIAGCLHAPSATLPRSDDRVCWKRHAGRPLPTIAMANAAHCRGDRYLHDPVRAAGKTFGPDAEATELAAGAMMDNMAGSPGREDGRRQPVSPRPGLSRCCWPDWRWLAGRAGKPRLQRQSWIRSGSATPIAIHSNALRCASLGLPAYRPAEVNALWLDDRTPSGALALWSAMPSALRFQNQEVRMAGRPASLYPERCRPQRRAGCRHFPPSHGGRQLLKAISSWTTMQRLKPVRFYRLLAAMEAQPVRASPALGGDCARRATETGFLAGELMQQVWVLLNPGRAGRAAVLCDCRPVAAAEASATTAGAPKAARRLEQQVSACPGLQQRALPAMLLRVGHPAHRPVHRAGFLFSS